MRPSGMGLVLTENDEGWVVQLFVGGHCLLSTKTYAQRQSARAAREAIRVSARVPQRFERITHPDGTFGFTLSGANGTQLAVGGPFPQERERDRAIEAVMMVAPRMSLPRL
jgi:hypothetical protein